jgi:hypothetical protein
LPRLCHSKPQLSLWNRISKSSVCH